MASTAGWCGPILLALRGSPTRSSPALPIAHRSIACDSGAVIWRIDSASTPISRDSMRSCAKQFWPLARYVVSVSPTCPPKRGARRRKLGTSVGGTRTPFINEPAHSDRDARAGERPDRCVSIDFRSGAGVAQKRPHRRHRYRRRPDDDTRRGSRTDSAALGRRPSRRALRRRVVSQLSGLGVSPVAPLVRSVEAREDNHLVSRTGAVVSTGAVRRVPAPGAASLGTLPTVASGDRADAAQSE